MNLPSYKKFKDINRQGPGSFLNVFISKFLVLKFLPKRALSRPYHAQIEPTNICNLKCRMCPQSVDAWKSRTPPKTLSLDEFKTIINRLPYVRRILLNGVGEPLINPDLFEMLRYAQSKAIKTSFVSNGTLLTEEKAAMLLRMESLTDIRISMDSGDPAKYEEIRVGAKFDTVCANIKNFIAMREKSGKTKPQLGVILVAMQDNVEEIPKLVDLLSGFGVKHLIVKSFFESAQIQGKRITEDQFKQILLYRDKVRKAGFTVSVSRIPDTAINMTENRTCTDPWEMVYVNVDGSVNPCCYSFPFPDTFFGNILESNLDEIWNNNAYKKFRASLKNDMPKCCERCPAHGEKILW